MSGYGEPLMSPRRRPEVSTISSLLRSHLRTGSRQRSPVLSTQSRTTAARRRAPAPSRHRNPSASTASTASSGLRAGSGHAGSLGSPVLSPPRVGTMGSPWKLAVPQPLGDGAPAATFKGAHHPPPHCSSGGGARGTVGVSGGMSPLVLDSPRISVQHRSTASSLQKFTPKTGVQEWEAGVQSGGRFGESQSQQYEAAEKRRLARESVLREQQLRKEEKLLNGALKRFFGSRWSRASYQDKQALIRTESAKLARLWKPILAARKRRAEAEAARRRVEEDSLRLQSALVAALHAKMEGEQDAESVFEHSRSTDIVNRVPTVVLPDEKQRASAFHFNRLTGGDSNVHTSSAVGVSSTAVTADSTSDLTIPINTSPLSVPSGGNFANSARHSPSEPGSPTLRGTQQSLLHGNELLLADDGGSSGAVSAHAGVVRTATPKNVAVVTSLAQSAPIHVIDNYNTTTTTTTTTSTSPPVHSSGHSDVVSVVASQPLTLLPVTSSPPTVSSQLHGEVVSVNERKVAEYPMRGAVIATTTTVASHHPTTATTTTTTTVPSPGSPAGELYATTIVPSEESRREAGISHQPTLANEGAEMLQQLINQGLKVLKVPHRGDTRVVTLRCHLDDVGLEVSYNAQESSVIHRYSLVWNSRKRNKSAARVVLTRECEVFLGKEHGVFKSRQQACSGFATQRCVSLVTPARSLDMVLDSVEERDCMVGLLRYLIATAQ